MAGRRTNRAHTPKAAAAGGPRGRRAASDIAADDGTPSYPIGSVDHTLRLLRLFGERKSIRIVDASRELGVARSTAHRMMQMLQYHGFVEQDPGSRAYVAGEGLVSIGLAVVNQLDVRIVARPMLESLVATTQETAYLVELRRTDSFFLDSVESPRLVRVGSRTGMSIPAHATATGRVLLADLSSLELRRLYAGAKLKAITDRTVTSRKELEERLEIVREQGFATQFGESEPDVAAMAVPVRDSRGAVRAALGVSSPITRVSEDGMPDWVEPLQEAAAKVSAGLAA